MRIQITDETIDYIANSSEESAWELRGLLRKICAVHELTEKAIDLEAVKRILESKKTTADDK